MKNYIKLINDNCFTISIDININYTVILEPILINYNFLEQL